MRRPFSLLVALCTVLLLAGADGCSSDPNVEGAKLYIQQEDYPAAMERLNTALAANPDNVDALVLKAQVLRLQAEATRDAAARRPIIEELATTLQRAQGLDPENAELANTRLAAWANEVNVGGTTLRNAGTDMAAVASAVSAFENAVRLNPDSTQGNYNLGLAHLVAGNAAAAIPPLEAAIAAGVADENAYVYLSRAYISTGRGADAVTLLESTRTRYPDSEPLQAELLNAYAATGQGDRALGAYEQAVANDPENALLRYNYGSTLLQAGRHDEAVTHLTRAAELDPTNANAHYNLGAAFQNKAATVSDQMREADDATANRLRTERDELLRQALPHFVEARRLTEASAQDATETCRALLSVYTTLGMTEEAREAGVCAGMDMN
jgi:tetratricopeptide (TPR) repeat protein